MICPNDNIEMHQVTIKSHYGQPIILEQCKGCGGIWFDESELFSAKQGEAEKIELLDSQILGAPSRIEKSVLLCPRDQSRLSRFKDRYFPKGIILERCPSCGGIWLNRGDFTRFQKVRQELQHPEEKTPADKKVEDEIKRILELHRTEGTDGTLAKLGRFLSTPMDRNTLLPLELDETQPEAGKSTNLILDVLMLVLRALVLR